MLAIYRYFVYITEEKAIEKNDLNIISTNFTAGNTFIDTTENINGNKDSFVNIQYYSHQEDNEDENDRGISYHLQNQNFRMFNNNGIYEHNIKNDIEPDSDISFKAKQYSPGKTFYLCFR